ncbi:MAG: VOC family protein [Pseudomonadota bacterium]
MTQNPNLVLDRGGSSLDHIALGVPDTVEGARHVAELTGVEPFIGVQPGPEQFYWSAALRLGSGRFLEILGPNPDWTGLHPMVETIKQFTQPQLLFWYVATDDIKAFGEASAAHNAPLEMQQTFEHKREDSVTSYTNAVIGPGFRSTRPCVIEWHSRSEWMEGEAQLNLKSLELSSPIAETLNTLFAELGIVQSVSEGPEMMTLTLDTPKGELALSAPGIVVEDIAAAQAAAEAAG